jgi:hypothetical protein
LPFVLIMALALWRSGVWERRVIREELEQEVGRTVSRDEYGAIVEDRIFRTRRIDRLHKRASAALVNAQHELAFRKRRVRDDGEDPERDPLVAGWRAEIARLRAADHSAPAPYCSAYRRAGRRARCRSASNRQPTHAWPSGQSLRSVHAWICVSLAPSLGALRRATRAAPVAGRRAARQCASAALCANAPPAAPASATRRAAISLDMAILL